ncbi:hypothetical protein [Nioella ostreopsis]|uniref:hypothetical protein n=1 Tax=Nioella ostreopsis TaxID=2448479 RepID=UPI000FD7EA81|nr:hypothetical protein [Nioella ostreopsis]
MAELFERTRGSLTFLAVHPVLDQMARDILNGLPDAACDGPPTTVYCGVHQEFGDAWSRPGFRIAIQTEQLYDAGGTALWPSRKRSNLQRILKAVRRSHRVLDLSAYNATFYDAELGLPKNRRKLSFGPHIFPATPQPYTPPTRDEILFFGWTGGKRRKGMLQGIDRFKVTIVDDGTFFDDLDQMIRAHSAVLNIHFEDGIYTEAPRLLSAYVCGKPVISEPLDPGFEAGQHYHLLGSDTPFDPQAVFEAFSTHVTGQFSFAAYLDSLGDRST